MPACPFHGEGEKQDSFPDTLPSNLLWIQIHQAGRQWPDSATHQRFIYSPESTGGKEKKIHKRTAQQPTHFPLPSFISGVFLLCMACDTTKPRASRKQKAEKLVFRGDKRRHRICPELQTGSDTFSGEDKGCFACNSSHRLQRL